jgi:hypothetical protein
VSLDLERLSYPFFDFVIDVERDGAPVWLRMMGREEAKRIHRERWLKQDCNASTQFYQTPIGLGLPSAKRPWLRG